jgi:hypothetical protein
LGDTKERLEKTNLDKEVVDEKIKQAEELTKSFETQLRAHAEQERQTIWQRQQQLMQEIEAIRREEAAREEACRREEAARSMRDAFGL